MPASAQELPSNHLAVANMSQVTIEDFSESRHPNPMRWVDDEQRRRHEHSKGLVPYKVCLVETCGFQFIFHSVMQVELCLEYYARELQPSSRLPVPSHEFGIDHWEALRWFERLPMYLLEKSKRSKVIAALERALAEYRKQPGAITSTPKPEIWFRMAREGA